MKKPEKRTRFTTEYTKGTKDLKFNSKLRDLRGLLELSLKIGDRGLNDHDRG
jgi:hypothetical protein